MRSSDLRDSLLALSRALICREVALRIDCANLKTVYASVEGGRLTLSDRRETFAWLQRNDGDGRAVSVQEARAICAPYGARRGARRRVPRKQHSRSWWFGCERMLRWRAAAPAAAVSDDTLALLEQAVTVLAPSPARLQHADPLAELRRRRRPAGAARADGRRLAHPGRAAGVRARRRGRPDEPPGSQRLYVTEKTVELHLTSAYRKLAIRSRVQLAAALR